MRTIFFWKTTRINQNVKSFMKQLHWIPSSFAQSHILLEILSDFANYFPFHQTFSQLSAKTKGSESQGQVRRPERVNQGTCPYDPLGGILRNPTYNKSSNAIL